MSGRSRAVAAVAAVVALAGCGGQRQDVSEPHGTFHVRIPLASFPPKQRLASRNAMYIAVRNVDNTAIPNVSVTIDSFNMRATQSGLASPIRPVWIVDQGPPGGETAYVSTWALGRLAPGQTAIFKWLVTPVESGTYHVSYRVAAGLNGKAVAALPSGGAPEGSFSVYVAPEPGLTNVAPRTGQVVTTPKSVPQPVPQVKPNTSVPIGPNEPTTPSGSTGGY